MKNVLAITIALCMVHTVHGMRAPDNLLDAIRAGDVIQCRHLLDAGHSPHQRCSRGRTALQVAVVQKHLAPETVCEIIELLLRKGAHVNDRQHSTESTAGKTALHLVALAPVAQLLLDKGAQLFDQRGRPVVDDFGNSPVHTAAASNRSAVVRVLLTHVTFDEIVDGFENKKERIDATVSRKLEKAVRLLGAQNRFDENPYLCFRHRGTISLGQEDELFRLLDGRHIDELREFAWQSASKAIKNAKK